MRVRMPNVPANFVPPELTSQPHNTPQQQNITSEVIIAPPPTGQHTEFLIPSTSAMHQVHPRSSKGHERARNITGMIMTIRLGNRLFHAHQISHNRPRNAVQVTWHLYNPQWYKRLWILQLEWSQLQIHSPRPS